MIHSLEMQIARERKGWAAVGVREPLETRMRGVRGQGEETERDSENNRIPPRSLEAAAAGENKKRAREYHGVEWRERMEAAVSVIVSWSEGFRRADQLTH